jgi:hypothetical protein
MILKVIVPGGEGGGEAEGGGKGGERGEEARGEGADPCTVALRMSTSEARTPVRPRCFKLETTACSPV